MTKLTWWGLCMSSLSPSHRPATQHFDEGYKNKQSESFLSQPEHAIWVSRHRTLRTQYLHFGVFLWKRYIILASYKDFLQVAKFLFLYSFTHTNIVFLFSHRPTEIVIFINICYQMKCFSGESFSFLGAGFANILPTFLILCEIQTRYSKTLKYSQQYIWDNLLGTKVRIWIFSEYDAVCQFFLHCLVQTNQLIDSLFHIIFIIRIRHWIIQTVNLNFACFWNIVL